MTDPVPSKDVSSTPNTDAAAFSITRLNSEMRATEYKVVYADFAQAQEREIERLQAEHSILQGAYDEACKAIEGTAHEPAQPSKELKFSWAWDADARNWRISEVDMGDGLSAGYEHLAGYYERRLIEEIERLRTTLTGISTCSTCEACRGAARLALGEQRPFNAEEAKAYQGFIEDHFEPASSQPPRDGQ